jgi:hypothetical protein
MKVEVGVPCETIPCSQHKTSPLHRFRVRPDGPPGSILPLFRASGCSFFMRLCYTIRMAEKIALVTGASSGFGLLTSIELAKAGFRVMATIRDLGRRDRLEQAVGAAGGGANIEIRALDVTKFDAIQGFVDTVVQDYGRLDVLVNNAGSSCPASRKISSSTNCGRSSRRIFSASSR